MIQSIAANKTLATVADSYYFGAIEFARQLAQDKNKSMNWLEALEEPVAQPRVEAERYENLLEAAALHLQEPLFGLKYGYQIDISSFNLLGYLAMSSATLAEASQMVNQYGVLVSEIGQLAIEYPAEEESLGKIKYGSIPLVKILWQPRKKSARYSSQVVDGVLAGWIHFGRKFLGEQTAIGSLFLTNRVAKVEDYQMLLDCPVELNASENYILVEQSLFSLPLKQAEPAVHAAIQIKAEQAKQSIQKQMPILADSIKALLPSLIVNDQANLEQLAEKLSLSTRSLQRKLKADNLSFRSLLDDVRRQLTLQLLQENEQPLSHIAGLVGFNEQSSFNRAFKRWTGQTPKDYLKKPQR